MLSFIPPRITLLYAGIMALAYLTLTLYVIRWRWKERRGLGFENNVHSGLFRAIRIHSHFAEFVPFTLLLMMLDEITGQRASLVHAAGITLVTARFFHVWAIKAAVGPSWQRAIAMLGTFVLLIGLGISLIQKGVS